uniref:Putative product n=1 Tax=Xenopsylla cheopis TaxID=163159 RepID=A0A6M2DY28_XENCH
MRLSIIFILTYHFYLSNLTYTMPINITWSINFLFRLSGQVERYVILRATSPSYSEISILFALMWISLVASTIVVSLVFCHRYR